MPVIVRRTGRHLAPPVVGQPHGLELPAHDGDVVPGPLRRVRALGHGGVLGGHPEGVPAHRVQDIETARAFVAGDDVADGVDAHMAHMDAPRRVGEHLQDVVFRPVAPVVGSEAALGFPRRLPPGLGPSGVVARRSCHERSSSAGRRAARRRCGDQRAAAAAAARTRNWRARVRMVFSRSVPRVSPTSASRQPAPSSAT